MASQNGRVNLSPVSSAGGPVDTIPGYGYQSKADSDFELDMLRGNMESSLLSKAYFSQANVQIVQNNIRKTVFETSQPKGYVIDDQSVDELKIIMRAMFYQYSRNLPIDIQAQVDDLNLKVVEWSAPHILSAVDHYYYYLDDISHMPVPLSMPKSMSSAGSKSLPFNPYM